jgi:hypothetical protein
MSSEIIYYLALAHGLFNGAVAILFFYQGFLGLRIRHARRAKAPMPLAAVRRHRKNGRIFLFLGLAGFLIGFVLVFIDAGRPFAYPLHFSVGLAISLLLISTYIVSRKIKGPDSPYRTPHFILGLAILTLYVIQIRLGLGILL